MSLNNGKQVDQVMAAVQDCDPVEQSGQGARRGSPEPADGPAAGPHSTLQETCGPDRGGVESPAPGAGQERGPQREDTRGPSRNGQGRFVPGNPGGPGNPFARRVGELRRAMLAAVEEEDVAEIINALVAKAKEGHVQAAKLVLSYVLGKPQPMADPDRADVDEWELAEETAAMSKGMAEVVKAPPASVPLRTARVLRPLMGQILQEKMADMLIHPENHFPELSELEIVPDKERPPANKQGPSPNGLFPKPRGVVKGAGGRRDKEGPSPNGLFPKPRGVAKGAGG